MISWETIIPVHFMRDHCRVYEQKLEKSFQIATPVTTLVVIWVLTPAVNSCKALNNDWVVTCLHQVTKKVLSGFATRFLCCLGVKKGPGRYLVASGRIESVGRFRYEFLDASLDAKKWPDGYLFAPGHEESVIWFHYEDFLSRSQKRTRWVPGCIRTRRRCWSVPLGVAWCCIGVKKWPGGYLVAPSRGKGFSWIRYRVFGV